MTDTSSLRAFIEARLAEDERAALAIKAELRDWETAGGWPEHYPTKVVSGEVLIVEDDADMATEVMPHIARHDPARVLREVEAKRAILAAYPQDDREDYVRFGEWESCSDSCPRRILDEVFKLLAQAWSDHPDYRTEWSTA